MKSSVISYLFCLFSFTGLFAGLKSPKINCVKVEDNGDVSLFWSQVDDPLNEFTNYSIFSSGNLNGNYTLIGSINQASQTNYRHSGANATNSPRFYYITSTSKIKGAIPAIDTARTIFLVLSTSKGIASLQWNSISSPPPTTASSNYSIYRNYPSSNFTLLDQTNDLKWKDTIAVCSYFFNYRIEIPDSNQCVSVSNSVGTLINDLTPPLSPEIDSVSINASNQTVIGLKPSASKDASCYVIYKKQGFSFLAIDTIYGNVSQLYINSSSNPNGEIETYSLASIDSCGNISVIGKTQNTILLKSYYSICSKSVKLGWNPYQNMKNKISRYEIFYSADGGPFQYSGFTEQTEYVHSNLISGINYVFYVRAINTDNSASSTSTQISFYAKSLTTPKFVYLKSVSVTENNHIEVQFKADSLINFYGVDIYRAINSEDTFIRMGSIARNKNGEYSFQDDDVDPQKNTYFYKAVLLDSCMSGAATSNLSKSIVLTVKSNKNRTNSLTWTNYSSYLGTVESFLVFRSIDEVFESEPIATLSGSSQSYVDDVSELTDYQGKFGYYVQAVEGNSNPYKIKGLSNSNRVETFHSDSIFVPTAFVPNGINKVFMPVTQFVEKKDYRFSIFDRWGKLIWSTQNENEGWDGEGYPGGLYVFIIEYQNAFGEYKSIQGKVLLIR